MLAADDHVSVWRDCEVERAELRIFDVPGRLDTPFRTERQNGVVTFAARTDAGRQKESAVLAKCKPARKRDHRGWKQNVARPIQRRRKRHDGPCGAQSDIVSAIGSEVAAARVKSGY